MTVEIPDDQVPEGLTEAAIRALLTYAAIDRPGASMVIEQTGEDQHSVRVRPDAEHYELIEDTGQH